MLNNDNRRYFLPFTGKGEAEIHRFAQVYSRHPSLLSEFSAKVHKVTVGDAIDAVELWLAHNKQDATILRDMLHWELQVWRFSNVSDADRKKEFHEHVKALNEKRVHNSNVSEIAATYNQACKQEWIRRAEEEKLLVTYDQHQRLINQLEATQSTVDGHEASIAALTEDNATLTNHNAALQTAVQSLTEELRDNQETHAAEIKTLTNELNTTKKTLTDELNANKKTHAAEIKTLTDELRTTKTTHAAEIKTLTDELNTTKKTLTDELNANKKTHAAEIKTLTDELRTTKTTHAAEIKTLTDRYDKLAEKMDLILAGCQVEKA
ncbi:hypothetical protein FN846DRAFT_626957 [Sphaerosporella brunnea]|uniref:Uncharacterized protein n=1 Tax=Sphaerosporella brunnea TaxID=1250544 RepID=A0A5J5FAD1_9PEZI|nr:hypothetical protein FN846DRAFT_626957 [Sphaerosporella brunnea]